MNIKSNCLLTTCLLNISILRSRRPYGGGGGYRKYISECAISKNMYVKNIIYLVRINEELSYVYRLKKLTNIHFSQGSSEGHVFLHPYPVHLLSSDGGRQGAGPTLHPTPGERGPQ